MRQEHPSNWDATNRLHLVRTDQVLVNPSIDPYLRAAGMALLGVVGLVLLVAGAMAALYFVSLVPIRLFGR
mgnify:CR=1 FL=1